jgi:ABC-type sugar transport system ATPase subunit
VSASPPFAVEPAPARVVALRGVSRRYGATLALDRVDLELAPGRVHAVVGENGAGKSTAAKIAAGVVAPSAGTLAVDGEEVSFRSAHDAEACGIVLIPQELQLYEPLSIAENLFVGRARPRGRAGVVRADLMRRRAAEVLERVGLDLPPTTRIEQLSPATRQLVAIARALVLEARVLIMDEPTAALDEWETQRLLKIVATLRGAGVSVLFVSHRLREVKQIADEITVMRDGKVVAAGPSAAFSEGELVRHMVGRPVSLLARTARRSGSDVVLRTRALSRGGQFSGVDLTLHSGEVLGMAGLIGSGRSEFAQALIGFTKPTGGTIELRGRELRPGGVRKALRRGLGYVPEERASQGLFLPLTVRENITLPALARLARAALIFQRDEVRYAAKAVEPLNLRGTQADQVSALSGGNQQKVLLARWIGLAPKVLVLDEPTRGIDVSARAEIYQIIDRLTSEGVAVLLISSDIQEIVLLSDRVVVMRNGQLVAEFASDEVTEVNIGAAALGAGHELAGAAR